jgi:ADP-heptose:LPS heptosyltransferase
MKDTVMILRAGSLGDTVVALPSFHHIRRNELTSRIVLLTNFPTDGGVKAASSYQVLAGSGLVDDYAEYRPPRRAADVLWLMQYFRKERPKRLYYLMPQRSLAQRLRDHIFFTLSGIPDVRGLAVAGHFDKPQLRADGSSWESESMRLLRMVGGQRNDLTLQNFDLKLQPPERARANEVLAAIRGNPYLLLSLGTKLPANDWGDENWRKTLHALSAKLPTAALVMIGSADESARCDRVMRGWAGVAVNLCGKLTPRESGAVAAGALLFLGHDSGPAHLAAAVGTKVVAVYSARNLPGVWFPFGNEAHVLWKETDCSNCGLQVCVKQAMRCIRAITPESVVTRALSVIADGVTVTMPSVIHALG